MAGVARTIKIFIKSKSLQPFWLGSLVAGFVVCHILFDIKSFKSEHGSILHRNLQIQVKSGAKAPFVLEEELSDLQSPIAAKKENSMHLAGFRDHHGFKKLYEYKNFVELPQFSKTVCRQNLDSFVPNVVHYIWFGKWKLTFLHYLSIRSAATIQRPSKIVLHTDSGEPEGKYWKSLKSEIPCLEVRKIDKLLSIFGQHKLKDPQQMSHIARLKILHNEGGIYANPNVIFIKPFDPLMKHSVVIGKEEHQYYSNSVILSARGATFLLMWFSAYNRPLADWSTYSIYIPYRLHRDNNKVDLHVEEFTMMRPNFKEDEWIVDKNWVLDENYCVHLYDKRERIQNILHSKPLDLINMDNTMGQLTRIALFGKPYLNSGLEQQFRSTVHSNLDTHCSDLWVDDGNVPNILHYVLEDDYFTYKHYLSVRSAVRTLKPESVYIYLLRDQEPDSFYWVRTVYETKCITTVSPRKGEGVHPDTSKKDVIKHRNHMIQKALIRYGGIYLSFEVIVTSSFGKLMRNDVVMGVNTAHYGDLDMILAVKNSKFLLSWFGWDKGDQSKLKNKIEKYTNENPSEAIKIMDDFPLASPSGGWQKSNFDFHHVFAFLVTDKDTRIKFDEGFMYDILRSKSLTGQFARIAHFGDQNAIE